MQVVCLKPTKIHLYNATPTKYCKRKALMPQYDKDDHLLNLILSSAS